MAGHIVSAVRKQRAVKAVVAQFTLSLFILGLQPLGQGCPHFKCVFPPQLTQSGNFLTDTPRGSFPDDSRFPHLDSQC